MDEVELSSSSGGGAGAGGASASKAAAPQLKFQVAALLEGRAAPWWRMRTSRIQL
jgi:hypothetical protein